MKKLIILLVALSSLMFVGCDAMSMAYYNEAAGNCKTYNVDLYSWSDNMWKEGLWYPTDYTQSQLDNLRAWADRRGNYYTYIKVGEYTEEYDGKTFKFVVTCY